ncbi:MAG: xanthine dehydrogenase large subunit [Rhodothermales bacterium]|jgi:xanthine dehydrogenase large subunit
MAVVYKSTQHDSARKHVAGSAPYVDDLRESIQLLHAYVGFATIAHGTIRSIDLSDVRSYPGVHAVITAADIPGHNDISPMHTGDEETLASSTIEFLGQPLFAVAAESREIARKAVKKARVEYQELPAILDIETALASGSFVLEPHTMMRGDSTSALAAAQHQVNGQLYIGGQDHFYLEGQISTALPQEDGDMLIHASSQHPSEVQEAVAHALALPSNAVTVEVRRMGGAFGGKETQAAQWAVIAALLADKTGRPVKIRLDRDDDMCSTGKRHDFLIRYSVGFNDDGVIEGIDFMQAARCGMSADLSGPIADRAMFHSDNAYYLPHVRIESFRCKTNTVSNTAFRGFGGPQGMMGIERVIDAIAAHLKADPLQVRKANFYGKEDRNITHYHMTIEDNVIAELIDDLEQSSDYQQRRCEILEYNQHSPIIKRGISLTPVKFGISFTTSFLNQAGALIHIYRDGSVHLNHGGTEMGQGLMTKVAQVVADQFCIDLQLIKVTATNTGKVPNTTATAASAGSDMNGMAARAACLKLKKRLVDFAADHYGIEPGEVVFKANEVHLGTQKVTFPELVMQAWLGRVSLSATGFYKTPKVFYDRETASGRPFLYFAYGASVSEVELDSLTGESRILRVDILHDAGRSLNPAVDLGQIEGGFIQGAGWLTTEELWWNKDGRLDTHAPSTYKIPSCGDVPEIFNARIWEKGRNFEETIHRSKAVGEPPLMLAISVHSALTQAVAACGSFESIPALDAPATAECLLNCIQISA